MTFTFRTKQDCLRFTKNLIYSLDCCYIHQSHESFNYFKFLISRNEIVVENIDYFSIVPNKIKHGSLETQIHYSSGQIERFSWNKCALIKKNSSHYLERHTMRKYIINDIIKFKNKMILNGTLKCVLCLSIEEPHVDHKKPFRELAEEYLSFNSNLDGWVKYHNDESVLQILCKTCNLKKH